ncbi:MAG: hypothetical protein J6T10_22625 [Methanobrevibacter sp.]|nr:hypothetical protein [Methanobrevibacter sp.]
MLKENSQLTDEELKKEWDSICKKIRTACRKSIEEKPVIVIKPTSHSLSYYKRREIL